MQSTARLAQASQRYQLEINIGQAQLVAKVCNLFARMQIGKAEELVFSALLHLPEEKFCAVHAALEGLGLKPYGIRAEETPETARIAYDFHRTMYQQLLHDERGFFQSSQKPHFSVPVSTECPLPSISLESDESSGRLWYRLEMGLDQAKVLSAACLLFSRAQRGLFDEVVSGVMDHLPIEKYREVHNALKELRERLEEVCPDGVPEQARVAYDLYQVFRHHLSGEESEQGAPMVFIDDPVQTSEVCPLARFGAVGEGC